MKKKIFVVGALSVFVLFTLTGCMPGDGTATSTDPAGFFWGIWHGWIAPISLIRGFFNESIRVYEVVNSGWWYDLGFYISIISGFGGLAFSRKKNKE